MNTSYTITCLSDIVRILYKKGKNGSFDCVKSV